MGIPALLAREILEAPLLFWVLIRPREDGGEPVDVRSIGPGKLATAAQFAAVMAALELPAALPAALVAAAALGTAAGVLYWRRELRAARGATLGRGSARCAWAPGPLRSRPPMLKPGDTFERYTIDAAIGQGGMGSVYRAHDARLDRRVALKVISDGVDGAEREEADARLLREARAAAALDHPNAVSIFDVGAVGGAPYIVMELVPGRTLREVVGDAGVPVTTRAAWLADVARALAAAHRRGLVHRDVKPENVMVRDDGVVKVLDFGIARRVGTVDASAPTQSPALPTLTKEGVKVGTPLYMAPEQIRGDVLDGRADQFAWGVLAYELLSGRLPWRGAGEPLAAVASILTDEPPRDPLTRAGVPPDVEAVVLRALEKRADARFASMDEVVRALDAALKGEPSGDRAPAQAPASAPLRGASPNPPSPPTPPAPRPAAPLPPIDRALATQLQRYSTEEVREILARAVERQEAQRGDSRLGFDNLVAAAREVGVDPDVLRAATRDLRLQQEAQQVTAAERDAWLRKKKRAFYRQVGIWVIVNVAFIVLGLADKDKDAWGFLLGPGVFWAIWLAWKGLRTFTADEDDWREEKEKQDRKERKKQKRSKAVERALDQGAAALLETGRLLGQRIAAPPPAQGGAAPRVRITADATAAEREAAGEDEAAAASRAAERRR